MLFSSLCFFLFLLLFAGLRVAAPAPLRVAGSILFVLQGGGACRLCQLGVNTGVFHWG